MAVIERLAAQLSLDATEFVKSAKRVDQNLNQMTRNVNSAKRAVKALGGAFGALAAAAGVGKLVGMANASLKVADNIGKVATQVGISTETVQVFSHAAEDAGFSAQQAQAALERFGRRIGLAGDNAGPAAKTLEKLGISVRDANGEMRNSDAILREVTDAIAAMESETERTAATTAIFGEDARRLQAVLAQGSAGLDEYSEQMRRAGQIMDEQMVRNAERVNDKLSDVSLTMSVTFANALGAVLPMIEDVADEINQLLANLRQLGTQKAIKGIQIETEKLIRLNKRLETFQKSAHAARLAGYKSQAEAIEHQQRLIDETAEKVRRYQAAVNLSIDNPDTPKPADGPTNVPPSTGGFGAAVQQAMKDQEQFDRNARKRIEADQAAADAKAQARLAAKHQREQQQAERAAQRQREIEEAAELAKQEARQAEFDSVVEGLKSEEERIAESYERRKQIILENTQEAGALRADLLERLGREEEEREKQKRTAMLQGTQEFLNTTSTLLAQSGHENTALYKAVAITEATIAGVLAVQKALASAPPPLNFALAGATAAITAANVAKISGIAHGGLPYVPREGTYLLDQGERVLSPEENRAYTADRLGAGGGTVNINVQPAENNAQARYTAQQVAAQVGMVQRRASARNG